MTSIMEDSLDFHIDDFENFSGMLSILENNEDQQENDLYEETIKNGKKVYRCTSAGCEKIFKFKSEITRHVIIHQKDRPYVCTFGECKKSFKRADALENHLRIHAGNLPFPCDIAGCDRSFVTKAALRYHKIRHNNNRAFKCEFPGCDKSFIVASQLKQHHKAFPFHLNRSPQYLKEEAPKKIIKHSSETQDDMSKELSPKSKDCGKIQWEMKTQSHEDSNKNSQEKLEMLFEYILNENKVMKEQLHEEKKLKKSFRKKETFEFQSDEDLEPREQSLFFDNNELKFLEFLKDQN